MIVWRMVLPNGPEGAVAAVEWPPAPHARLSIRAIAQANLRSKMDNDEQVRHEFSGAESQSEQRGAQ